MTERLLCRKTSQYLSISHDAHENKNKALHRSRGISSSLYCRGRKWNAVQSSCTKHQNTSSNPKVSTHTTNRSCIYVKDIYRCRCSTLAVLKKQNKTKYANSPARDIRQSLAVDGHVAFFYLDLVIFFVLFFFVFFVVGQRPHSLL